MIVEQVGVVAGEQETTLRRFGIEHARLDLVDPPDHLVGMRHQRGVGQRTAGTDEDADSDDDEDQRRKNQRQLVAPA